MRPRALAVALVFACSSPAADPPPLDAAKAPSPATKTVPAPSPTVEPSDLKSDESVVFVPSFAHPTRTGWSLDVQGWVFEPENDGLVRKTALELIEGTLGLPVDEAQAALAVERLRFFMVDNERGKRVVVNLGSRFETLGPSGADGRFAAALDLSRAEAGKLDGWARLTVVLRDGDDRSFEASVQLLDEGGISVLSDIDDTIKLSDVHDKKKLLENTFLHPYRAAPGMPELYQRWAGQGAAFHYISNSPLPLVVPLVGFFESAGLPRGSIGLRPFRWRDGTFLELLDEPEKNKQGAIESVILAFERRRFILVGDTGERDPEIYAAIARKYADRIARVYLRAPTGRDGLDDRLEMAFAELPDGLWRLFEHGDEIKDDLGALK